MKCPKCGFENPEIASYCVNCGTRIDGKILCPKCNKPISPDVDNCPYCNKKIPHEGLKQEKETISLKKKNAFNKIFLIVSLALIAVGIIVSFGQYVSSSTFIEQGYGFSWFYLFKQWSLLSSPGSSNVEIASIYIRVIIQFLLVLFNIGICLVFGIMGLVKTIRSLCKKGEKTCNSFGFVTIILCSNLLSSSLINSMNNNISQTFDVSLMMKTYIWSAVICLAFMCISYIFLSNDRKRKVLLIEKILFGCTLFLGMYLIYQIANPCLISKDGQYRIYGFFEVCLNRISSDTSSMAINQLVLSSIFSLFAFFIGLIVSSQIIFASIGFFSEKERNLMYKIPCYVLGFMVILMSTIALILNGVLSIMLNVEKNEILYLLSESSFIQFITSNLLFGSSVACLGLIKGYRNYQRIVASTTKK